MMFDPESVFLLGVFTFFVAFTTGGLLALLYTWDVVWRSQGALWSRIVATFGTGIGMGAVLWRVTEFVVTLMT